MRHPHFHVNARSQATRGATAVFTSQSLAGARRLIFYTVYRPPIAGGAPSHYDDPAWYADEAWALQEERNAESAREAAEAEDEHTHPCPTCHQARPCTGTGCADGPQECATCSQCRGW